MSEPLRLLIVEDNPLDAELLLRELARAGYEVQSRRVDSEAGFRAALRTDLDLVLSDFELPQFTGLQALALLRQSGLDLPFILVSGTIGEDLAVTSMKEGASDYLMKDRLTRLGPAVSRALERKRLEREARRADQTARDSANFIHDVLNSLTAAVVVLDQTGKITAVNEAWRRFARENGGGDCLGENYLEACRGGGTQVGGVEAERASAGIRAVLGGMWSDFAMEYACHSPTEQRWFLMRVSPLGGQHRGAVVAHEKITELKRAELTLRESEERFRRLIENASDIIAVVAADNTVAFLSPSAKPSLDYRPEELVGRPILDFLHPDDRASATEALTRVRADHEGAATSEYRFRHRDGSWRIFQSMGKSMVGPQGERLIVINARDVTETRKLEEQFLRTQRLEAIGTLSSGIAHDLNNILAPMLMVVPMLREKLPEPEDGELLTLIENAAQRGANIIRQLLTFSRGIEGQRAAIQPRYLLKEMMAIMRETFPREINLEQKIPTDLWPVIADATQIHQVLLNLCVNARDAMATGGRLTLAAENTLVDEEEAAAHPLLQAGRFVCLTIIDTGEGIPRENLRRIFEPFFTTKEIGKGTGLGLSTVMGIVKSHGGFVLVDSEVGHGTAFRVHLPAIEVPPEAAASSAAVAPRGAQEMILVVDDEEPIRRALGMALGLCNYRVLFAADGREALRLFGDNRDEIQLVLTDLMMPGMNGVALVRALRALAPGTRIIAASGLHDEKQRQELASLDVRQILAKPCSVADILAAIQLELAPKN